MIMASAIGVVWLYWCAKRGISQVLQRRNDGESFGDIVRAPPAAIKDLGLSAAFIILSVIAFPGVTGMLVGLLASLFVSIVVQIDAKLNQLTIGHPLRMR